MEKTESLSAQKRPELQEILDMFKQENLALYERSVEVESYCDRLKSRPPEKENPSAEESNTDPIGVVDHLFDQLNKMRLSNERLSRTAYRLGTIIGT